MRVYILALQNRIYFAEKLLEDIKNARIISKPFVDETVTEIATDVKRRIAGAAVAERYSQTASKAEQIALCQFIRDGHLTSQTKKLKKLYAQKLKALENEVRNTFGRNCTIQTGAAGTSLALTIPYTRTGLELKKEARMHGMSLLILEENAATITILLSCSSITTDDFAPACQLLSRLLNK